MNAKIYERHTARNVDCWHTAHTTHEMTQYKLLMQLIGFRLWLLHSFRSQTCDLVRDLGNDFLHNAMFTQPRNKSKTNDC